MMKTKLFAAAFLAALMALGTSCTDLNREKNNYTKYQEAVNATVKKEKKLLLYLPPA